MFGPGAGFALEGTVEFIYEGAEFELMKEAFSFMNRVFSYCYLAQTNCLIYREESLM